jgi:hypothetical protein
MVERLFCIQKGRGDPSPTHAEPAFTYLDAGVILNYIDTACSFEDRNDNPEKLASGRPASRLSAMIYRIEHP